jgi:hypothetical protein
MNKNLFDIFNDLHPEFINELNSLPNSLSARFVNNLKKEKDRINFLSKISEFRFVQFFINENLKFEFDKVYLGKKPDLKIFHGNRIIISDIKRFNLPEEDQKKADFFYNLVTSLKTINKPYIVRITQNKDFEYEIAEIKKVCDKFDLWLNSKNILNGAIFNYHDFFSIEIVKPNIKSNFIQFGSYSMKDNKINPNKILNIVKEKIDRYKETFIDIGIPFFVCIDIVFETLIEPSDFENRFQGNLILNTRELYNSNKYGLFHNQNFNKILGLLIRYNGNFYWIQSPNYKDIFNFKTTLKKA